MPLEVKQLTEANRAKLFQIISIIGKLNHLIKVGRVKIEIEGAGRLKLVH